MAATNITKIILSFMAEYIKIWIAVHHDLSPFKVKTLEGEK